MADKDLFAPPSKEELAAAQGGGDTFAPPTSDELNPGILDKLGAKVQAAGGVNNAIGEIPLIGSPIKAALDNRDAINRGLFNGLTDGLSDKAEAGAKALAETATKSADPEQDKLDQLIANYKKYKGLVADKDAEVQNTSPMAYGLGKAGGKAGQGMATFALPETLIGKVLAGTGAGAINGALESDSDDNTGIAEDAAKGGAIGMGGTLLGEKVLAPAAEYLGNKAVDYLSNKAGAKQLAATVLNSSEGNSLFGQKGAQQVEQSTQDLAGQAANTFTDPISAKNKDYTTAFQAAADAGKKVEPSTQLIQSTQDFLTNASTQNLRVPPTVSSALQDLQSGALTPDKANSAIQQLKALIYNNPETAGPLKNSIDNLVGDLSTGANATLDNTTLQDLNKNKSAAWQVAEEGANLVKSASSMDPATLKDRVNNYIYNLLQNAGKSTDQGVKANVKLAALKNNIDEIQQEVPLGIDTDDLMKKISNLGYLKAASQNVTGIRSQQNSLPGIGGLLNKITTVPERAAEAISGSEGVQDAARRVLGIAPEEEFNANTVASKLVNGDKDVLSNAADLLNKNPATAHLGESLKNPENKNINATIFSIMQNPTAKQQLGIGSPQNTNSSKNSTPDNSNAGDNQ